MVFFVRNRPNIEGDVLPLDFPSVWREISSNANTLPQTDGISEEIDILTSVRFRDVTMLTSPEFLSFFGQTYRQLTAINMWRFGTLLQTTFFNSSLTGKTATKGHLLANAASKMAVRESLGSDLREQLGIGFSAVIIKPFRGRFLHSSPSNPRYNFLHY